MIKIEKFVSRLASVTLTDVFNPYKDCCPVHDTASSAIGRCRNLKQYLTAMKSQGVNVIWFGRDLGYRGGRRTGIALTDEVHLPQLAKLCSKSIEKVTRGSVMSERTAAVIWQVIARLSDPPFLWNVFPLHPHEAGDPMSNRSHSKTELAQIWDLNAALLDLLQPTKLIAIGNDAHETLIRLGLPCEYVRHPSYGGQTDFLRGMNRLYGLPESPKHASHAHLLLQSTLTLAD